MSNIYYTILYTGEVPVGVVGSPTAAERNSGGYKELGENILLIFNLWFLYIISLNGLSRSMSDLAGMFLHLPCAKPRIHIVH